MKKIIVLIAFVIILLTACTAQELSITPESSVTPLEKSELAEPPAETQEAFPTQEPVPTPPQTQEHEPISDNVSYDFRNVNWGMPKEDVIASENEGFMGESGNFIVFEDITVGGKATYLLYYFNSNDKLCRGIYTFDIQHSNKTDYITDYEDIKESLIEIYGTPVEDEVIWKDDYLYGDRPAQYGMAVATGDLAYRSRWSTGDTNIMLFLVGDNYEITLIAEYTSTQYPSDIDNSKDGL